MTASPRQSDPLVDRSVRVYRLLLRVCPRSFRKGYGPSMTQLVRDRCRDARTRSGRIALLKVWLWALADLAATIGREHWSELMNLMKPTVTRMFQRWVLDTAGRKPGVAFAATLLLTIAPVTAVSLAMSNVYSSTVRVVVTPSTGRAGQAVASAGAESVRAACRQIRSAEVLGEVIQDPDLERGLAAQAGATAPLTPARATATLERLLEIQPIPKTGLFEIRVYGHDPVWAAKTANRIAAAYARSNRATHRVEVIDAAEPGLRPVRPNLPLNLVIGLLLGMGLAGLAAFLTRRWQSGRLPGMSPG